MAIKVSYNEDISGEEKNRGKKELVSLSVEEEQLGVL